MTSRSTLAGLVVALLVGCHPAEPKAVQDAPPPEREVSIEVELLDLPAAADPPNVESPAPKEDPRKGTLEEADKDKDAQDNRSWLFRDLFDKRADDKKHKAGEDPAQDVTIVPPPPPPPHDGEEIATIRQATGESVGGRVEPASIQEAVDKNRSGFSRCLSTDTKVIMEATIASSGDVVDAHSTSSQPDDPKLRDCVVDAFKRLKLRPLASAQPARVKFALALKRSVDY